MTDGGWRWDPSLYAGSAAYYATGRVPYPVELADLLAAELALDGRGELLDVGCGPGSLTLLLAPRFEHATGLDPDAGMLAEGRRRAFAAGVHNITWVQARAEELPGELGPVRVVTLAQSFHWMDRERVAGLLHAVLEPEGALVHVHATTHRGLEGDAGAGARLHRPRPPWEEIDALVRTFLGERRRAGQGVLPAVSAGADETGRAETEVYARAGFVSPTRITVPGAVVTRSADDVVASVFSLSSAAPHLFGDRMPQFERELRAVLHDAGPDGWFSEQMREVAVDVWRT